MARQSLLARLSTLPDPRINRTKKHRLGVIQDAFTTLAASGICFRIIIDNAS